MYADLQAVVNEWGVNPPETVNDKDAVSRSLRQGLASMDVLPSFTSLDFEYPDDALVILADSELCELKYPFDEDDLDMALNDLADLLGG
jgi:hypothetical protein